MDWWASLPAGGSRECQCSFEGVGRCCLAGSETRLPGGYRAGRRVLEANSPSVQGMANTGRFVPQRHHPGCQTFGRDRVALHIGLRWILNIAFLKGEIVCRTMWTVSWCTDAQLVQSLNTDWHLSVSDMFYLTSNSFVSLCERSFTRIKKIIRTGCTVAEKR